MKNDTWVVSTQVRERFPFYTRANIGEVFPDPVAPASFSYAFSRDGLIKGSELGFREAYKKLDAFTEDEYDPDNCVFLGVHNGYAYLNASMMRLLGHRAPGMTTEDIDSSFFGEAPGVPPYVEQPGDTRPELTEKIGEVFGWALSVEELEEVSADEAFVNNLRAERPDIATMTDQQLHERSQALFDNDFPRLFTQHIFITGLATLPVGIITAVCEAVGKPEATLRLMSGLGDVESAAPSTAMWNMSRLTRDSSSLTATFENGLADSRTASTRARHQMPPAYARRSRSSCTPRDPAARTGGRSGVQHGKPTPTSPSQPSTACAWQTTRRHLSCETPCVRRNERCWAPRSQRWSKPIQRPTGSSWRRSTQLRFSCQAASAPKPTA